MENKHDHKLNGQTNHADITQMTVVGRQTKDEMEVKEIVEMRPLISEKAEENAKDSSVNDEPDTNPTHNEVPIDRGWAWMVLLGATLEMLIVVGMLKSSGIFFVAFQERFGSSSSLTSLINTVENAVWSVSGILRDNTGSYIAPFHLLGTLALVGGLLMISLPLVERCYKNSISNKKRFSTTSEK